MTRKLSLLPFCYTAAAVTFLSAQIACAQTAPVHPISANPTSVPASPPLASTALQLAAGADAVAPLPSRAQAYYHMELARLYEQQATAEGHPELASQAIEEFKIALNADPTSAQLNDALADLYLGLGRSSDAESTVRQLLKTSPNDIDANKLLGRLYLRRLSEGESSSASATNSLDLATTVYEKLVSLEPASVDDRMILGQLYTAKHDAKKAEAQFKAAQQIDPDSEEVVLNLAHLYADTGDYPHAIQTIEAIAVNDRTAKMEDALGADYEQLKQSKPAIAAFQRAVDIEQDDLNAQAALAEALADDNQFDESLKHYQIITDADPDNVPVLVHICEIQRHQGKFEEALATIHKARLKDDTDLQAGYNEGLLLDILGRYDDAASVFTKMVDQTSHANGAYTAEEKVNRGIFLERLGIVYQEQYKIDQAIAAFQKLIDMGGDNALTGYRGQISVYSDAKMYDKALLVARSVVASYPKDRELKLLLADQLGNVGKSDEAFALAKSLLNNTPSDRAIWISLGQMYIGARRWKDAEDAFNKSDALTTEKDDRIYLFFLRGELAERQKHDGPAEQFFRQALELDPDNAMTLNYLGYMMADKGTHLPEALQMIRKAVAQEPSNGAYLDSLGWVYFKMGEYELAEVNLRTAVDRDQTDPTVHDHLGDLYEKTNRIRLAAAQWEMSIAQYAKSSPTDVAPGDLAKVQRKLDNARAKLAKDENAIGQVKTE